MEVYNFDILHFSRTANISGIQECLKKGIKLNVEGDTALQVAAAHGFLEVVNFLTKSGASIDLPNHYGWTPLMLAARNGHASTVDLLLKRKAKVNICNKLGLTPVVAAVYSGSMPTVKLLVEAGAIINLNPDYQLGELTSLMAASLEGHNEIFEFLVRKGADVNQASPVTGLSPLMLSACGGHERLVKVIVDCGGDTNGVNVWSKSAAYYANESGIYLKTLSGFSLFPEDIPVVRIDSPDNSSLFESFNPHEFSHRSGSSFQSEASEKLSERVHSKKGHQETKVKEWIGGVAHQLQSRIFSHRSSKSPDFQCGEESVNEVFETSEEIEKPSIFLSPDHYLANTLKEHVVEAIRPPFPLCSFSKAKKSLQTKKEESKPPVNSLFLPSLLKDFSRKHFEQLSGVSYTLSSKGFIYDENKTSKTYNAEHKNLYGLKSKQLDSSEEKYCSPKPTTEAGISQCTIQDNKNGFDDLRLLLDKESLKKYAEKFHEQEVDLTAFKLLTKDDLEEMGIQNLVSQKKLIELIHKLNRKG